MPPRRPRDPVIEREFLQYARRYRPKRAKLNAQLDELIAERNEWMKRAHAAGLSVEDVADAVGLTRPRAGRIIRPKR